MPGFGSGFGSAHGRRLASGGAPAVPPILSVESNGWVGAWNPAVGTIPTYSVNYSEFDPEGSGKRQIQWSCPGYDNSGNSISRTRRRVLTKRLRKTWTASGNHLTADGDRVALDACVLQGETSPGITNNSTETGFAPVAHHLVRNRRVVGNTAYVQVGAAHWSGMNKQPVACVKAWYRSVDGTKQTDKVTLTGPEELPGGKDRLAVLGYHGTIPVSTWNDSTPIADGTLIIREVEVYPHLGTLVKTTVGQTADTRGFTPQTDYKHAARVANPIHVEVAPSGGVDETVTVAGVGSTSATQKISTDITVVRANPFATITKALEALKAATTLTGGFTDGCIVNLRAGAHTQSAQTLAGTYQQGGETIIRTDPIDAAYGAVLTLTGYPAFRHSWIVFQNMEMIKGVNASGIPTNCRAVDIKMNGGGFNSACVQGLFWVDGIELTNFPANAAALTGGTIPGHLARGVLGTNIQVDCHNLAGSRLAGCALVTSTRPASSTMLNGVFHIGGQISVAAGTGETVVEGIAWINYMGIGVATGSYLLTGASEDNKSYPIQHFVRWGGTELGSSDNGRRNQSYDESDGTVRRNNKFWDERCTIATASFIKSDIFAGANKGISEAECALRTGSWGPAYGTHRLGVLQVSEPNANTGPNFSAGGSENHQFFGLKVKQMPGRTSAYQLYDVKFAGGMQNSVYWNGSATVAGNINATAEDFQLNSDSPAIGILTDEEMPIPIDIFGNARDRGSVGAAR